MDKVHFTNKEDALRYKKNFGGEVVDNRHSAKEWNNNNFTVVNKTSEPQTRKSYYPEMYGDVVMTREQHERWMESKGWSEKTKQTHRDCFTGHLDFDGYGGFSYV